MTRRCNCCISAQHPRNRACPRGRGAGGLIAEEAQYPSSESINDQNLAGYYVKRRRCWRCTTRLPIRTLRPDHRPHRQAGGELRPQRPSVAGHQDALPFRAPTSTPAVLRRRASNDELGRQPGIDVGSLNFSSGLQLWGRSPATPPPRPGGLPTPRK
jgi:hypothetical protein